MSISVITRAQARAGGLSRGTIDGRLRSKQYEALHRGIYLVGRPGSPRDDWLARMAGHIARGGPGSAVSHRAAALLGGLEGIEGYPEDLLVPHGSSFRAPPAIRTRSLLPEEIHVREGLPTTKPERTLSDLAAVLPINSFEVAFESALRSEDPRRPLEWDVELWHRIVESLATLPRGRRGVGSYQAFLARRGRVCPTGSFAETMALQAFRRVGLGRLCRQPMVELVDANGRRIQNWFPDFGDLARGIAFEIDGVTAHSTAANLDRDLHRQNLLTNWLVIMRWSAARVLRDPMAVAGEAAARIANTPCRLGGWTTNGATVRPREGGWTVTLNA